MIRYLVLLFAVAVSGCAQIQTHEHLDRETGAQYSTTINDEIFRIHKSKDLPNAFGKADVFGGKTDAGTTELRFMGLTEEGQIIFRLTDVDVLTNESTMSRYGSSHSTINATSPYSATVQTYHKPEATSRQLPPNTVEFLFDPADEKLTLKGLEVRVLSVSSYEITYFLSDTRAN